MGHPTDSRDLAQAEGRIAPGRPSARDLGRAAGGPSGHRAFGRSLLCHVGRRLLARLHPQSCAFWPTAWFATTSDSDPTPFGCRPTLG